ncbi:MAG: AsmA-like C-terminal region-containing protein [Candidatus Omnitrophota bacterium]
MKKIVIILLILVIAVISAFTIFLATFDLNRYNRSIASQIETVVGNPVEIGRVSLKWKGRLLLDIEKFRIFEEENGQKVPALSFDHADMSLEIMPLLSMQLKVSSASITRLSVHLIRAKDGVIIIRGYSPKAVVGTAQSKPSTAPAMVNFSIGRAALRDSAVRFEDMMMDPPADIVIDSIDADIKNISINGPVQFAVKMSVFSEIQNFDISGTAGGFAAGPLYVKDLGAGLDLGTINNSELMVSVPALRNIGIGEGMKGALKVNMKALQVSGGKIDKILADLKFNDGRISLSSLREPVEGIGLLASLVDDKLSVDQFSARLANAALKGSADVSNIFAVPQTAFHLNTEISALKEFLSKLAGGRQYLDGKVTLSFDGTMSGSSSEEILKSLSGSGLFTLDNGVILDTNLIRQSLGAIAMFPGLVENLSGSLPAPIKDAMDKEYTLLKPFRQSIIIKDGVADLPDLKIETDLAEVKGAANLTLQGELAGNGVIRFSPDLSEGMIKAVGQMRYLAGQDNIVEFPITFKASGAGASVMPDLQYIGTKVTMQKGQEMVTDLFKKAAEPKPAAQGSQAPGQTQPVSSLNAFMENIKTMANEGQKTSGGSSQ